MAVYADGQTERFDFHVEYATLGASVDALAEQAGAQLVYSYDLAHEAGVQPVIGRYTLREALDEMFRGTSFSAGLTEDGVVTISFKKTAKPEGKVPNKSLFARLAASVPSFVLAATAANAQDGIDEAKENDQDTIVVTALKRQTDLLDTPLAVSAFRGSDLERIGANGLGDFIQFAPGVSFEQSGQGEQSIFIRGLASTFGNTPVGYYLDEVPFVTLLAAVTPDVRAFDLERVEVLRGPQGTLYGASSLGGTIRILTNDPVHNEFQAKGDFSYSDTKGGESNYGLKGAVNIPLIEDKLSLRLVGTQEEFGGWIELGDFLGGLEEEDHNNFDVWTTRAKLRYTPSDDVDIVLGYWRYDASSPGSDFADETGLNSPLVLGGGRTTIDRKYDIYSGEITVDLGFAEVTSSTSYTENDVLSSIAIGTNDRFVEIFNQEMRLVSQHDGPFSWIVGGIYSDMSTALDFSISLPSLGTLTSIQDTTSKFFAIYGEATYALADNLDVTAGLRYFEDEFTRNDSSSGVPFPEIVNNFDDISPRFNLAWRPAEDALVYATVSKGFRSGFAQPAVSIATAALFMIDIPEGIEPEDAWNYELGGKFSFLDGRATLDVAGYYIDWTNLQATVEIVPAALGALVNAGEATAYGFEWTASYELIDNLNLAFSGNWNESTYDEDVFNADGVTLVFEEGAQIQQFPPLTLTGSADYSHELGSGWSGVGRVSVEYVEARTFGFGATQIASDDITRVNARLGVENESVGVYVFAENLNNYDGRATTAGTVPLDFGFRYRPRTIGVNVKLNY